MRVFCMEDTLVIRSYRGSICQPVSSTAEMPTDTRELNLRMLQHAHGVALLSKLSQTLLVYLGMSTSCLILLCDFSRQSLRLE